MDKSSQDQIVCDLSFRYQNECNDTLSEINQVVKKGSCVVLCGSSGCGKTTLLCCVNHLIPQFYEGEIKGFCLLNGKDVMERSVGEVGEEVASVFQDPRSQFFTTDSSAEVAFGLENFGYSRDEIVTRVNQAYQELGLEKLKDRNVFELSSGERQLVAILAAKALDADVLILDEPTANLDFSAICHLSALLAELKALGKTILISEHRLYYLKDIADEFILMDQGRITERIAASDMMMLSEEELEHRRLRTLSLEKIKTAQKVQQKQSEIPNSKDQTIISSESLAFSYHRKKDSILSHLSLKAKTGDVIGIVGSNGSGKTTLGKLLTGLIRPISGKIFIDGIPQTQRNLQQKGIFIMQEAEFQFFTNSVLNELKYGIEETPEFFEEVERVLKEFDMWTLRDKHPFSLSGGQMQKLVLLMAYFSPKPIAVFDEPTAGLDLKSLMSCVDIFEKMRRHKTIFIITHDLELISRVCTKCVCIANGTVRDQYDFSETGSFERVVDCMQKEFCIQDNDRTLSKNKYTRYCDPRIKFAYLITALFITSRTVSVTGFVFFAAVFVLLLYEKRYRTAAIGAGALVLIFAMYVLLPPTATGFIMQYMQIFLLLYMTISAVSENGNSSRITAGLRKLHIPEMMITIVCVIFRFFPVLSKDIAIVKQSMKTRGVFKAWREKVLHFPEYFEILIVPMIFRVIRIAEALAASAETRGIALHRKRESYISLKIRAADVAMAVLLVACIVFHAAINHFI